MTNVAFKLVSATLAGTLTLPLNFQAKYGVSRGDDGEDMVVHGFNAANCGLSLCELPLYKKGLTFLP
jgi:hypothetical protein